ncbi:hypothetical protein ACFSHQ_27015 [Gemmobacter lanyuensis]
MTETTQNPVTAPANILHPSGYLRRNPSVLWFLLGLAVLTLAVTLLSPAYGGAGSAHPSSRHWARRCVSVSPPSRWISFGATPASCRWATWRFSHWAVT